MPFLKPGLSTAVAMKTLRVLQVEDNEDDAQLVIRALRRAGYDVTSARVDNADALRRELISSSWDLVIADYTMPQFDGATALNLVRERDAELPFIFVSGTIGEDIAVAAMKIGADDYIMKGNLARLAPAVERELRDAAVRRERHLANQRVAYLAYHDPLTDLPNRTLFHDRLQQAILRSQRDDRGVAVLLIDLDAFKAINDELGHHTGDFVLQETAMRLRSTLRASDTVARLGGDEFAVLLPATDMNRAELAARKVLHDFEHPIQVSGRPLIVGASIGIAATPVHATNGDDLLQAADAAMYFAKKDRCGFAVFNPTRDRRIFPGVSMTTALRQAIEGRQLIVDYQPIVHVPTGEVQSVESLVRWDHPERGRLLPEDFIRVAEHSGLVKPLTAFVLERALSEWSVSQRPQPCGVTVNLSPRSLHHAAFPHQLREVLETHRRPPDTLWLEITENLVMSDPDGSIRCLCSLHDMGVNLVIDDFGKGYSSLSYLRQLPVDEIKIDRSFVMALDEGEDETLVRCMIDLAHNLGLGVVAEGVETQSAYERLVELGCDCVQGYYVSRPAPAAAVLDWMTNRSRQANYKKIQ